MSKKFKVLCIDDEEDILEIYDIFLEDQGFEIVTNNSPSNAMTYIEDNFEDIVFIFCDFNMPEMDGLEFREKMIVDFPGVPFAMVTGVTTKKMALRAMELNICGFVSKPFEKVEMAELLQKKAKERIGALDDERIMITSFLEESNPMLSEIEGLILDLEEDPTSTKTLNTYFRLLHTIKGTAACVGLNQVSHFTHKYEDLIGELQRGELPVNTLVVDILLKALDVLKDLYARIIEHGRKGIHVEELIKIFDCDRQKIIELGVGQKKADGPAGAAGQITTVDDKKNEERISVDVGLLDSFMEMSGELTVSRNTIIRNAQIIKQKYYNDEYVQNLGKSLEEMYKVSTQMQRQITELRKVKLKEIFRPFKRLIRDISSSLEKDILFHTAGEEIGVDTSIGKLLSNILIHMLRNSIDHGIESNERRAESGKDPRGTVTLSAEDAGEDIIVVIEDDGGGIDQEKVKEKALEKELYSQEELEKMSKMKVLSLIFDSGFSTAEAVTDLSGRGVGMDMVKSSIEEINGKILIFSDVGVGTKFEIVLPKPKAVLIVNSLIFKVGKCILGIPTSEIREIVSFDRSFERGMINYIDGKYFLNHSNKTLPVIELDQELGIGNSKDKSGTTIFILRSEKFVYGIFIDEILDNEEVVVKKLCPHLSDINVFSGVSYYGNGDLSLFLDIEGLASNYSIDNNLSTDNYAEYAAARAKSAVETRYMFLNIASESHYAIRLDEVYRLEEVSFESLSYCGDSPIIQYGRDALNLICLKQFIGNGESHIECADKDETLKIIVLKKYGVKFGLLVDQFDDIVLSTEEVDTSKQWTDFTEGLIYLSGKTVSMLDIEKIIAAFKKFDPKSKDNKFKKLPAEAA
jgi:two-component system, chemotaxis family, sensor kinase CheA